MQELWVEKQINERITKKVFKYYEIGLLGCGIKSKPFLDMTNIVGLPENKQEILKELMQNLLKFPHGYNKVSSLIPQELNDNKRLISYYYYFIEKYLDKKLIDSFQTHDEFDRYILNNLNCKNWETIFAPRTTDTWFNKSLDSCQWRADNATPKFKQWVESLRNTVFDQIGRIIVFKSRDNQSVMLHRDYFFREHQSHFINFQFDERPRPAFVYDEVAQEKIYFNTPCYMFNECDLHGVDACNDFRFTVRIDGVFKSSICQTLGLNQGRVWDSTSESFSKANNVKIIEPVYYA